MRKHIATIITGAIGSVLGAAILSIVAAVSPMSAEWAAHVIGHWAFPWVVGASAGMLAGLWIDRLTAAAERKMPPLTKAGQAKAIAQEVDVLASNLRRRIRGARREDWPRSISDSRAMLGRLKFVGLREPCIHGMMDDALAVRAYASFFDQIAPALRAGNIRLAREIADGFVEKICQVLRDAEDEVG